MKIKKINLVQGRWTKPEQDSFNAAMSIPNKTWAEISELVGTRTPEQCRSHFQKLRINCRVKELTLKKSLKIKIHEETPSIKEIETQCCDKSFMYPPILKREDTDISTNNTPVILAHTSPFREVCNSFNLDYEYLDFTDEDLNFLKF